MALPIRSIIFSALALDSIMDRAGGWLARRSVDIE